MKIDDLDISIRCFQSLRSLNINNLEELSNYTPKELLKFSKKSIEEIEFYMKKYNVNWKQNMKKITKITEYWFVKPVSDEKLKEIYPKLYPNHFYPHICHPPLDIYYFIRIKTSGLDKISWVIGYENENNLVSRINGGELKPELVEQLENEFLLKEKV